MSSGPDSAAARSRPRSRRSIAHIPRSKMTSGLDKENATTDNEATETLETSKSAVKDKKSRSKSLGPGGLDALQKSTGNRRQSTALLAPKSILKPTLPVSPVRNIPSFAETRRRIPAREASNQKGNNNVTGKESALSDFTASSHTPANLADNMNPFDTFNATSVIRDEMAATKERDEKERRERERQNILEKREARRKSMANRRVSFAPEATLHTWNVMDIPDDSTASTSTNSTRKASSLAAQNQQPSPEKEAPFSSDDDVDSEFGFSPVRTQDLEQMRNNSAPSQNNGLSSSPFSGSSGSENEDTGAHSLIEEVEDGDLLGSDEGFDAESTVLAEEITGVFQPWFKKGEWEGIDENEDMSMDVTNVIGGILRPGMDKSKGETIPELATDLEDVEDDQTMDMTNAIGGILLPGIDKSTGEPIPELATDLGELYPALPEDEEDQDIDMEMTNAVGGILLPGMDKSKGETIPELAPDLEDVEDDQTMDMTNAIGGILLPGMDKSNGETIPELANDSGELYQSPVNPKTATPPNLTPDPKPRTPAKTPPSASVTFRSASPKKLFRPEIIKQRRSSGLGIEKEGLGSPRVAELLDKRPSLGDGTLPFIFPQEHQQTSVRFEDPLKLQAEEEREREEEELREDGHLLQPYVADGGVSSNLRDMISSLSPKKTRIGSRKSLHVGAARGILGKRPIELDLDEDEAMNSPKRLRGHNVSPVKGVKLPAPIPYGDDGISAQETASDVEPKMTRIGSRKSLHVGAARGILGKRPIELDLGEEEAMNSPGRLRGHNVSPVKGVKLPAQTPYGDDEIAAQETASDVEPIQLQEFLNMTNVHFMELTTTKRRHTTAPGSATKRLNRRSGSNVLPTAPITLDDCVAAGFCTVPMLELYQHSCRELKSYISEGRQVIRSIEAETYENNPPLFREYVTAPADIRVIMDNQFRNVKTHARLLSKATWYEWRMKLLEGLKDGLIRHVDEMKADDELLSAREDLLNATVPALVEKNELLEQEAARLQQHVDEMENSDQDELRGAREQLSSMDEEIKAKKLELQQLQLEAQEKTASVEAGTVMRDEYVARIQDAEQIKEKCRGWSARDISVFKTSVERIERETGWAIISASASSDASNPTLTMSYRDQLQVMFHPSAFATKNSSSAEKANLPLELTPKSKNTSSIASLVLQSLQKHLLTINQSKISSANLLKFISTAWDRTLGLENEVRMLEFCGVTRLTLSDPKDVSLSLRARCTILGNTVGSSIPTRKGSTKYNGTKRIDVDFTVRTHINPGDQDAQEIGSMDFDMEVLATKVYGFGTENKSGLPDNEMQSILGKGLDGNNGDTQLGNGVWCKAVQQLTGSVF